MVTGRPVRQPACQELSGRVPTGGQEYEEAKLTELIIQCIIKVH